MLVHTNNYLLLNKYHIMFTLSIPPGGLGASASVPSSALAGKTGSGLHQSLPVTFQ